MAKVLAVANQKGGVGKTTTSINLAASLAVLNKKVLLMDSDPQGNATIGLGFETSITDISIYNVLIEGESAVNAIKKATYAMDFISANVQLAGAEAELAEIARDKTDVCESRLKLALEEVRNRYDYILIDCPPSLGFLTLNALCAADDVLLPIQCEFYALDGCKLLVDTIKMVHEGLNSRLNIAGILMTMFDSRTRFSTLVVEDARKSFGDLVYQTMIPRTVRLSEAPSYGKPIYYYDRKSKGAEAYLRLAKEVISRDE